MISFLAHLPKPDVISQFRGKDQLAKVKVKGIVDIKTP